MVDGRAAASRPPARRQVRRRARRRAVRGDGGARSRATRRRRWSRVQTLEVDRERARFSTWYELFPRSWGGFKGVTEQLPQLAELGFDVLYLPPVHPIGETNRKGRNNAVTAGQDDPGSPWAIGHHGIGGHEALHPELGTMDEFEALIAARRASTAWTSRSTSPSSARADHPWLTEHPEWFNRRPDGTLKYAENPPKKYQDIYNVNWNTRRLARALGRAATSHPRLGRRAA